MQVLIKNKNVFSHGYIRIGQALGFEATIDTGDNPPVFDTSIPYLSERTGIHQPDGSQAFG